MGRWRPAKPSNFMLNGEASAARVPHVQNNNTSATSVKRRRERGEYSEKAGRDLCDNNPAAIFIIDSSMPPKTG